MGRGRDSKLSRRLLLHSVCIWSSGNSLVILVLVACKKLRSRHGRVPPEPGPVRPAVCLPLSDPPSAGPVGIWDHNVQGGLRLALRQLLQQHVLYNPHEYGTGTWRLSMPSMPLKVRTISMGTALSLVVWLTALVATSPLLYLPSGLRNGILQCYTYYNQQTLKWKIFIHFEVNILGLLILFSVLMFCYIRILHQLRSCQNHNKTKAIKLVLIVVASYSGSLSLSTWSSSSLPARHAHLGWMCYEPAVDLRHARHRNYFTPLLREPYYLCSWVRSSRNTYQNY